MKDVPYATSLGDILDDRTVREVVEFLKGRNTGQITLNAKDGIVRSIDVRKVISVNTSQ